MQQLQDLGGEYRHGRRVYQAKLKGQTIEEYKPDITNLARVALGPARLVEEVADSLTRRKGHPRRRPLAVIHASPPPRPYSS